MRDRYCAGCGRKPVGRDCCWFVEERPGAEAEPGQLVPAKPWEQWNADHRFLTTLLVERFGGAAEEWELLCRLPWASSRLANCVFDAASHGPEAALHYPCLRETDLHGRGVRYLASDLARDSYEAYVLGGDPEVALPRALRAQLGGTGEPETAARCP
jgi:hypothetical protein